MEPPLASIVEQFEAPLLRYATRIVGDRERARDVVQDTFLRLHENDPGLEGPPLRRWLFTVCRNRAIDLQRQQRRWQSLDAQPESAVEARGEDARSVAEVLEAVEELPADKREVVALRLRGGHSYAEISERTGLTVSHVGVILHHAVRRLRARRLGVATVAGVAVLLGLVWHARQPPPRRAVLEGALVVPTPSAIGAPSSSARDREDDAGPAPSPSHAPVARPAPSAAPSSAPPVSTERGPRAPGSGGVFVRPPQERPPPRLRAIDVADPYAD